MSIAPSPVESAENWEQLRDEWIADLDALYREIEGWAASEGWATRRYPEEIEEDGLGRYQTWRLLVHAPEGRAVFQPIARRVLGDGTGLIDLSGMPSMHPTMMMVRRDGRWGIHPFGRSDVSAPWTQDEFLRAARSLFATPY